MSFDAKDLPLGEILDAVAQGVLVVSATGTILAVNRSVLELFGYSKDELVGANVDILVPAPYRAGHDEHVRKLAATRQSAILNLRREVYGQRKDGAILSIDLQVGSYLAANEMVFVGTVSDISPRKHAESQLREHALALEAAHRESETLRLQAEAGSRSKSAFLANMSHEIRTPMTAILGFSELLSEAELSATEREEAVHSIQRNGQHLLGIINDILDLSKIEAGCIVLNHQECHVVTLVDELLLAFRERAREQGISLTVGYRGDVPASIITDPLRLSQILVNLVGNAIKFTTSGGVHLSVQATCHSEQSSQLSFAVTDTGIGISQAQLPLLFQPFSQADSTITRRFGGTGLGVSISRRLSDLLGGTLSVQSEVGRGSTFTLSIPVCAPAEHQERVVAPSSQVCAMRGAAASPADGGLRGCQVLLAEDGPDNQRLISHLLRKAGAEVIIVDNGQDAINAIEFARCTDRLFDVILMDMQMPVLDGYSATRRIREQRIDWPIIAITAHAMSGDRESCLAAGCNDYLTKPVDRARLLATIGAWFRPSPIPVAARSLPPA